MKSSVEGRSRSGGHGGVWVDVDLSPDGTFLLPGRPQFLGYIAQQFRVYGGQVAHEYSGFVSRIDKRVQEDLVSVIQQFDPKLIQHRRGTYQFGQVQNLLLEGKECDAPYDVSSENFFQKVTDLAAFRIMHLHPRQMEVIHPVLMEMCKERKLDHFEDPAARVWDMETERYFKEVVRLKTIHTEKKMYTSVHYVVLSNWTTRYTCEIQVRTLADEVWGEVDHEINYPLRLKSIACTEQIKSLAHVTTSCNRLVDSIFASHKEWKDIEAKS